MLFRFLIGISVIVLGMIVCQFIRMYNKKFIKSVFDEMKLPFTSDLHYVYLAEDRDTTTDAKSFKFKITYINYLSKEVTIEMYEADSGEFIHKTTDDWFTFKKQLLEEYTITDSTL